MESVRPFPEERINAHIFFHTQIRAQGHVENRERVCKLLDKILKPMFMVHF